MSLFTKKTVYLDYAAAGKLRKAVLKRFVRIARDFGANPAGLGPSSKEAEKVLSEAKSSIARLVGAKKEEIIITSGGTESNNLALLGVCRKQKKGHIIATAIEHPSVLEPLKQLEREGFEVTYVTPDEEGLVQANDVFKHLREDTVLVTVMLANNELGSILPIQEIGKGILSFRKEHKDAMPYFHVDACQAFGYMDIKVDTLHVDLLTLNATKVGGLPGVGLLYARTDTPLAPVILGGEQQYGKRPGTENTALTDALATALELAAKDRTKTSTKVASLRDELWNGIQKSIPNAQLNGPALSTNKRLPNNLHVSFVGCDAEALLVYLSGAGISAASGSACSNLSSEKDSHVLKACLLPEDRRRSAIRFTLGSETTKSDIRFVLHKLPDIVTKVREMTKQSHG